MTVVDIITAIIDRKKSAGVVPRIATFGEIKAEWSKGVQNPSDPAALQRLKNDLNDTVKMGIFSYGRTINDVYFKYLEE